MKSFGLVLDGTCPPETNMLRDLQLLEEVIANRQPGILRIYNWSKPAITVGHHQRSFQPHDRTLNIPVIKRPTGGGAVLHLNDITYTVIAPLSGIFSSGIIETYSLISRAFAYALSAIGLDVTLEKGDPGPSSICFMRKAPLDITINGKKLMGSAQLRINGFLLQQGVIAISTDKVLLERALGPLVPEQVASIEEYCASFEMTTFLSRLKEGFCTVLGVSLSSQGYKQDTCGKNTYKRDI